MGYEQPGFGTGRSIGCRRFQREGRKDSPELRGLDHGNRGVQTFGVELRCNGTARAYRPKSQTNLSGTSDVRYATHTLGTRTHCGFGLGVGAAQRALAVPVGEWFIAMGFVGHEELIPRGVGVSFDPLRGYPRGGKGGPDDALVERAHEFVR